MQETTADQNARRPKRNILLLNGRKEVAKFLGISLRKLTAILYGTERSTFYKAITLHKANGSERSIHAVKGALKNLQRVVLEKLNAHFHPTAYAHGFIKGRSIVTNAHFHRQKRRVIKVDLKDFFPSITFPRVAGMFRAPPFSFGDEAATIFSQIVCLPGQPGSLPQGGVTSPYVANMLCRRLDKKLARLAADHHCHYTRYADDITLSTNDIKRFDPARLLADIDSVIESERFHVRPEKTRVLAPNERQIVAGVVVNSGLNVNRRYIRNLRATLHNCEQAPDIRTQIAKAHFKDPRNARSNLVRQADGQFAIGGKAVNDDEAVTHFFRHVIGKIIFFGQIIESNISKEGWDQRKSEGGEDIKKVLGEGAFCSLMLRCHRLITREQRKYKSLSEIEKGLTTYVANSPFLASLNKGLDISSRRWVSRKEALGRYKESDAYRSDREFFESEPTDQDLTRFVAARVNDPRFFFGAAKKRQDRSKLLKLIEFPPISYEITRALLRSWDSGTLRDILHDPRSDAEPFTAEIILKRLQQEFDPIYFLIPKNLREHIVAFADEIDIHGKQFGFSTKMDLLNDPRLGKITRTFRREIRFGDPDAEKDQCSSLQELIREVVSDRKRKTNSETPAVTFGEIDDSRFFSYRPALRDGLRHIVKS